jgi:hypothetical protein
VPWSVIMVYKYPDLWVGFSKTNTNDNGVVYQ